MSGGERPIGAAKGKQSDTEALCQPPPPSGELFVCVWGGGGMLQHGCHTAGRGAERR